MASTWLPPPPQDWTALRNNCEPNTPLGLCCYFVLIIFPTEKFLLLTESSTALGYQWCSPEVPVAQSFTASLPKLLLLIHRPTQRTQVHPSCGVAGYFPSHVASLYPLTDSSTSSSLSFPGRLEGIRHSLVTLQKRKLRWGTDLPRMIQWSSDWLRSRSWGASWEAPYSQHATPSFHCVPIMPVRFIPLSQQ